MNNVYKLIVLIILVLSLCGCSNSVHEFKGAEQYADSFYKSFSYHNHQTWKEEKDGSIVSGPRAIVPSNFEEQDIVNYYNKYEDSLPLGEAVQTLLSVQYTKEGFEKEVSCISGICYDSPIVYDETSFSLPAYITVLGWNDCSEYVLVDSENCILHYVFLQSVKQKNINIPAEYLPEGYSGYCEVKDKRICIYE